LKIVKTEGVKR